MTTIGPSRPYSDFMRSVARNGVVPIGGVVENRQRKPRVIVSFPLRGRTPRCYTYTLSSVYFTCAAVPRGTRPQYIDIFTYLSASYCPRTNNQTLFLFCIVRLTPLMTPITHKDRLFASIASRPVCASCCLW